MQSLFRQNGRELNFTKTPVSYPEFSNAKVASKTDGYEKIKNCFIYQYPGGFKITKIEMHFI